MRPRHSACVPGASPDPARSRPTVGHSEAIESFYPPQARAQGAIRPAGWQVNAPRRVRKLGGSHGAPRRRRSNWPLPGRHIERVVPFDPALHRAGPG